MSQMESNVVGTGTSGLAEAVQYGPPTPGKMIPSAPEGGSTSAASASGSDSKGTRGPMGERSAENETDLRWILREACWSRMFGKADAKNPFTK